MIQGLRTAVYPTPDLARGKAWYRQVFERDPYFDQPFYVGFAVGGFELGLVPDGVPGTSGAQVYWGVPDVAAELARLTRLGAELHEPVQDVGEGIRVASVRDPFGNLLGLIENPHFLRGSPHRPGRTGSCCDAAPGARRCVRRHRRSASSTARCKKTPARGSHTFRPHRRVAPGSPRAAAAHRLRYVRVGRREQPRREAPPGASRRVRDRVDRASTPPRPARHRIRRSQSNGSSQAPAYRTTASGRTWLSSSLVWPQNTATSSSRSPSSEVARSNESAATSST